MSRKYLQNAKKIAKIHHFFSANYCAMQILPQIKAQIFADCKTKRKKLRKQKCKNNRKIPLAPYSQKSYMDIGHSPYTHEWRWDSFFCNTFPLNRRVGKCKENDTRRHEERHFCPPTATFRVTMLHSMYCIHYQKLQIRQPWVFLRCSEQSSAVQMPREEASRRLTYYL